MLFLPRESFPTDRVDVDVLFARELARRGHCIDFVMQARDHSVPTGRQTWNGRTVWVGPTDCGDGFLHRLRRHWLAFVHDVRSLRHARRPAYEAIQVRDKYLIAFLAVLVARARGLKFFYWLSFPESESQLLRARDRSARYPRLAWIRGKVYAFLLYRWILPLSDHVFVQSQRMKEDVCARGARPSRVTPVPMGIDPGMVRRFGRRDRSRGGHFVTLVYLGVIAAERRLDVLVDMLALLRRDGADVRLLIVGDAKSPEERLELERRAQALGLDAYLRITGFLPREQALARAAAADIGLSPIFPTPVFLPASPTKLVEYLALGLPVVANDHPEQRLVLRETRAGVCIPWGARHFARAVRWLMRRTPQEREAMASRGRAWVEANRTYTRIADALERQYVELLS